MSRLNSRHDRAVLRLGEETLRTCTNSDYLTKWSRNAFWFYYPTCPATGTPVNLSGSQNTLISPLNPLLFKMKAMDVERFPIGHIKYCTEP